MPRFFVAYLNPGSQLYETVNNKDAVDRSWLASDGTDANGQAALYIKKNGKYVSFPIDGVQAASLLTSCTDPDANILYTSKIIGPNADLIRVRYVVSGNNTSLSVSVSSNDITVNVATNGSGVAVSTAALVKAAVDGSGSASALVSTALVGAGAGIVNAFGYTNLTDGSPQATLTLNSVAPNSNLLFKAQAQGTTGNDIRVRITNPGTNNATLSVSVSSKDITISPATNGSAVITTTASQAITAVNASATASALVLAQSAPGSDGTGVVSSCNYTYLTGGQYGGAVATDTVVAYGAESTRTTY